MLTGIRSSIWLQIIIGAWVNIWINFNLHYIDRSFRNWANESVSFIIIIIIIIVNSYYYISTINTQAYFNFRWGAPHVASLSFNDLGVLKKCLGKGEF